MAKKRAADSTGAAAAAAKLAVAAAAVGAQAKTQARSQASDLGDRIAPVLDDARDRLAPVVGEARERLVDLTGTVATRIDDLTSGVSERLDDLTGTVATRIDDALPDRYTPTVVATRVPVAESHPNRLLQAVFVLGLGTVAALVTRRLTGGSGSGPAWRSAADQPTTSSDQNAAGQAAAATAGESAHGLIAGDDHASGNVPGSVTNAAGETGPVETSPVETSPVETSVDVAGGTPEEVAADATDTPHAVTTPDDPARKVVLD